MPPEGNGSGSEGTGNAGGDAQQQLSTALQRLGAMETELKGLKGAKDDLERKLDDADKELLGEDYLNFKETKAKGSGNGGGQGDRGRGEAENAEIDLDRASNREIVEYIQKKYSADLGKAVKDLGGQLEKTTRGVGMALAQVDISLTAMRHDGRDGKPSFTDNFNVVKEIAKANPSWDAEKCYQQFILEKDKSDREKAEGAEKKAEEERKALTEKGEGVPASVTQGKQLTKEEAATLAYRKAFGNQEK